MKNKKFSALIVTLSLFFALALFAGASTVIAAPSFPQTDKSVSARLAPNLAEGGGVLTSSEQMEADREEYLGLLEPTFNLYSSYMTPTLRAEGERYLRAIRTADSVSGLFVTYEIAREFFAQHLSDGFKDGVILDLIDRILTKVPVAADIRYEHKALIYAFDEEVKTFQEGGVDFSTYERGTAALERLAAAVAIADRLIKIEIEYDFLVEEERPAFLLWEAVKSVEFDGLVSLGENEYLIDNQPASLTVVLAKGFTLVFTQETQNLYLQGETAVSDRYTYDASFATIDPSTLDIIPINVLLAIEQIPVTIHAALDNQTQLAEVGGETSFEIFFDYGHELVDEDFVTYLEMVKEFFDEEMGEGNFVIDSIRVGTFDGEFLNGLPLYDFGLELYVRVVFTYNVDEDRLNIYGIYSMEWLSQNRTDGNLALVFDALQPETHDLSIRVTRPTEFAQRYAFSNDLSTTQRVFKKDNVYGATINVIEDMFGGNQEAYMEFMTSYEPASELFVIYWYDYEGYLLRAERFTLQNAGYNLFPITFYDINTLYDLTGDKIVIDGYGKSALNDIPAFTNAARKLDHKIGDMVRIYDGTFRKFLGWYASDITTPYMEDALSYSEIIETYIEGNTPTTYKALYAEAKRNAEVGMYFDEPISYIADVENLSQENSALTTLKVSFTDLFPFEEYENYFEGEGYINALLITDDLYDRTVVMGNLSEDAYVTYNEYDNMIIYLPIAIFREDKWTIVKTDNTEESEGILYNVYNLTMMFMGEEGEPAYYHELKIMIQVYEVVTVTLNPDNGDDSVEMEVVRGGTISLDDIMSLTEQFTKEGYLYVPYPASYTWIITSGEFDQDGQYGAAVLYPGITKFLTDAELTINWKEVGYILRYHPNRTNPESGFGGGSEDPVLPWGSEIKGYEIPDETVDGKTYYVSDWVFEEDYSEAEIGTAVQAGDSIKGIKFRSTGYPLRKIIVIRAIWAERVDLTANDITVSGGEITFADPESAALIVVDPENPEDGLSRDNYARANAAYPNATAFIDYARAITADGAITSNGILIQEKNVYALLNIRLGVENVDLVKVVGSNEEYYNPFDDDGQSYIVYALLIGSYDNGKITFLGDDYRNSSDRLYGTELALYMLNESGHEIGSANVELRLMDYQTVSLTYNYIDETEEGATRVSLTQNHIYGSFAVEPDYETTYYAGRSIDAWVDENGNAYDFETPIIKNTTLTAIYSINQYTAYFYMNSASELPVDENGNEIVSFDFDYGTKIARPADPYLEGYTFHYWTAEAPTALDEANVMPGFGPIAKWTAAPSEFSFSPAQIDDQDKTLYAYFKVNSPRLTLVSDTSGSVQGAFIYNTPIATIMEDFLTGQYFENSTLTLQEAALVNGHYVTDFYYLTTATIDGQTTSIKNYIDLDGDETIKRNMVVYTEQITASDYNTTGNIHFGGYENGLITIEQTVTGNLAKGIIEEYDLVFNGLIDFTDEAFTSREDDHEDSIIYSMPVDYVLTEAQIEMGATRAAISQVSLTDAPWSYIGFWNGEYDFFVEEEGIVDDLIDLAATEEVESGTRFVVPEKDDFLFLVRIFDEEDNVIDFALMWIHITDYMESAYNFVGNTLTELAERVAANPGNYGSTFQWNAYNTYLQGKLVEFNTDPTYDQYLVSIEELRAFYDEVMDVADQNYDFGQNKIYVDLFNEYYNSLLFQSYTPSQIEALRIVQTEGVGIIDRWMPEQFPELTTLEEAYEAQVDKLNAVNDVWRELQSYKANAISTLTLYSKSQHNNAAITTGMLQDLLDMIDAIALHYSAAQGGEFTVDQTKPFYADSIESALDLEKATTLIDAMVEAGEAYVNLYNTMLTAIDAIGDTLSSHGMQTEYAWIISGTEEYVGAAERLQDIVDSFAFPTTTNAYDWTAAIEAWSNEALTTVGIEENQLVDLALLRSEIINEINEISNERLALFISRVAALEGIDFETITFEDKEEILSVQNLYKTFSTGLRERPDIQAAYEALLAILEVRDESVEFIDAAVESFSENFALLIEEITVRNVADYAELINDFIKEYNSFTPAQKDDVNSNLVADGLSTVEDSREIIAFVLKVAISTGFAEQEVLDGLKEMDEEIDEEIIQQSASSTAPLLIIADFFPVWYAVTNSIEYYAGKEIADIRFADKADLAMHYNLFTDADTIAALAQFGNLGFTFETLYGDTYDLIVNALYPYSLRIIKIGYEEIISEDSDLAIGFAAYLSENFAAIEGTNDEFVAAEDMVTLPNQWILNNFVFSTLPDERIISLVITEGENVYELVSVEDDTNITTYSFITNPFTFDLSKAYEISFTASSIRASVTFTPVTDLAIVDLEGEPEESSFVVDKNTVLSQEQIPVLSSLKHNFLGWSYADGEMFDPATPITSDTVLFAVWEAKTFSLIIDRNDGGNVELVSSEILYGELSPVVPEAPSKDGYYFMDWRVLTLDEDGNEIELRLSPIFNWNEDTITSDITVVARYAPIVMVDFDDVSLVLFDGDEYDIVSEYFDIYEVDGLSFAIKYTKAITNGELEYIIRFMIDGMPESAVTYRENSLEGEAFELTDGNIFDSIELGEIIDGVYVDYLGDMNAFFTYALFDENDTLIQIVGMHIYIDEYVESSVTVSWTDPTDSENTVTKEIKVIAGGLLDFVEADENGIITINGVEYATDFASAGYDFVGLVGSDGKAYDFERKITADQEISFVFERRSYEITFEYDGITLDAAAEVLHGETINPDVMMSAGEEIWYIIWYELDIDGSFTAWYYLDEEGNRVEFDDDMPITKALTIYALVAETEELSIDDLSIAGEYTIDEEVQNKLVLEMDDNIILLDYLAALDFSKFEKDTIEAVIYVQLPASYNIAELLFNADSMFEYSYFATETEGLFGISILLGMGDPETHQYEMLGDGERLIDNTCTRATFVMRGIDADGFAVRDFRFDIAIGDYEEVEAEIVFVPDSITYDTITYNLNTVRGRTLDIANIFVSEDKSVKEEAEEIHGYTFDGWFTTLLFAKTEIDFETFLFEADKTVVTANYTKDYFDISYYDWDNTANDYATEESKEYQAEFEEKIISDDAPDASGRTGYHFAYWASRTLDDDGNYVYTEFNYLTELVLEDIDLYAVYVVDVYEVVFLVEGYEGVEEFSIGSASYGSYIQLPQPMIGLAYLGLFFDGWFVEGFETEGMTLTADQYLDGGVDGDTIYVMAAFKDNELTKTIEAETEGDEKGQYEAAYDEGEIVDGIFASVKNIYTEKDGTVTLIVTIDTTGDFDYDMVRLYFATMGSNYDSYSLKTISETEENLFVLTYVIADENGPVEGGIEEYLLLAYYDEDGNIVATKNFVVYFENYYNTLMEEMVALQNEFNIEASIYPLGTMARLENILAAIDTYESRLDEQAVEEFRNWLASPSVDFAGLYMAALREKYNAAVSSNLYDIAGIDGLAAFLADATNQLARANVSDMKAIYLDTLAKMDSVPTVAEKTLAAAKTAAINDLFLLLDEHKKEISRYAKGNDELLADMIESYGEILDGLGLTNVASLLFEFEIRQSIIKAAIGEYFETDEFIEAKAIEDEAYSLRTTLSSYFANMITEYDERAAQAIQDARDFITEKISEEPIREGYEEYTDIFESLKAEIIAKVADLDQIAKINALYDEYKAREAELIAEYDRLAAAIRAIEEARQFITEKISEESVPFDYEQYTDVFESLKAEIIAKAAYLDDITKINALYDEYKAREGELVAEYDRLAADAAKAAAADDKKALAISDATLEKIITDVLASRYGITLKAKHELLPFTFTLSAEEIETKLAKITNLLNTRVEAGVFADTIKVSIVDAFESYIENVLSIDNMDSNVVILLNQYKNELLDEINSVLDRSDRMDEAAAKAVDEMILSLGKKPTEESVKKARDAYKALNARQKTLVKELATLEEAENPSYLETLVLITFALAIGLTIITIVILLVIRKKRRDDDDDPRGPNGSGGGSDDDDSEKKTDSTNNDKNVNAKDEVSGPSKSAQNFFYNEDSLAESQRDEDLEDDDEDFEAEENDDEDEIEYEPEEDVEDDGEINEESQKEGSVISAFQGLNVKEKKSITQRMTEMSDFNKQAYGIIKNEIMSHKNVNNRMTKTTENFSFKRTPIIKLSLVGKTLRVYLGLDPNEYSKSIYHHKDVSAKKKYATVPLMMKVKNQRTVQRILELVTIVMDNNGISKKRKFEETDYYSELKNTALTPLGRMGYEHLIASKVNAEDADVLSDEVAFELVTVRVVKEKGEIRRERFSTSDINSNFMSGDTVDIATLQKKRLISKSANYLCITAEGTLEKTVNVVADEFEVTAAKMILLLGGSCTNLES